MFGAVNLALAFGSALLAAGADSIIKKLSDESGFYGTVINPWMIAVCVLYFIQILFAVYIFTHKGGFALYGNLFNVFYSILMVGFGLIIFGEHLTRVQFAGIALALVGIVLLNAGL